MATSAIKLMAIIDTLSDKFHFDKNDAIKILSENELLPKKLLPKIIKPLNISTRAFKEAYENKFTEVELDKIKGSGKNGCIILKDIKHFINNCDEE